MKLAAPTPRAAELVTLEYFVPDAPADDWQGPTEIPEGADGEPVLDGAISAKPPVSAKPLPLTYFDDCGQYIQKDSVIKGVITIRETSAWIAPPGAGKSALLTEISVACAAGIDWHGHKTRRRCGVVIFALERADLFKRRLQVYRQRDGLSGLPIAVADQVVDILDPRSVDLIVNTVKAAAERFGCDVGLVGIDTYAKAIAAAGGDEDKARDQNRAAAHLRMVHSRIQTHIALVGHTGKDESRGARGSNAHVGDVDIMVQISGDTVKRADVIKGNDSAQGELVSFRLEAYELGRDEDGDPITTSIVVGEDGTTGHAAMGRKKPKLPPVPTAALRALLECAADNPAAAPPDDHIPKGVTCVTLDTWRARLAKLSIINPDGNPRQQFLRIHVTLKNAGAIGIWGDFA